MRKYSIVAGIVLALILTAYFILRPPFTYSADKRYLIPNSTLISNEKQLTFSHAKANEAYYNKDKTQIIYQAVQKEGNPYYQIFVQNLATGEVKHISPDKGGAVCGFFDPSSNRVLWASSYLSKKHDTEKNQNDPQESIQDKKLKTDIWFDNAIDIYTSDQDGKNIVNLGHSEAYDAGATYSTDGKQILFTSTRAALNPSEFTAEEKEILKKSPYFATDIYKMKADGSDITRLTTEKGYDGTAYFSFDGSQIVYSHLAEGNSTGEIFVMKADGSDKMQLTQLGRRAWAPFFHPSGKYIIFAANPDGKLYLNLFIVANKQGAKPVLVSTFTFLEFHATFSADGLSILWTRLKNNGDMQIYEGEWNHELALRLVSIPND